MKCQPRVTWSKDGHGDSLLPTFGRSQGTWYISLLYGHCRQKKERITKLLVPSHVSLLSS